MKKYGNDYRQRGEKFEYTGKWYGSSLSVKELKRHALNNTVLMAAALVIYFASLMLNNEGSRIFWILLPYMVVVFPVSYGIMGGASLFLFCSPCFLWNHGRCFLISFLQTAGGKSSLTGGNPGKAYRAYDLCTV